MGRQLTPRKRAFAQHYAQTGDVTASALAAGYTGPQGCYRFIKRDIDGNYVDKVFEQLLIKYGGGPPGLTNPRQGEVERQRKTTGGSIAVFDDIEAAILREMSKPTHVLCVSGWLTNRNIISKLTQMRSKVVIGNNDYGRNYGSLDVTVCDVPGEKNMMHHKFMVLGDGEGWQKVITGSFNYTENAKGNRENIVILEDESIAKEFALEFYQIAPDEPLPSLVAEGIRALVNHIKSRVRVSGDEDVHRLAMEAVSSILDNETGDNKVVQIFGNPNQKPVPWSSLLR